MIRGKVFGLLGMLGWALGGSAAFASRFDLHSDWTLLETASGKKYSVTVPSTVLAALVDAGVYPNLFMGMNLQNVPGSGPVGGNFAKLPMPQGSPFSKPWVYRTEFDLPRSMHGKNIFLHFDGINYRASVKLNGKVIASSDQLFGIRAR